MAEVDAAGGIVAGVAEGRIQDRVSQQAYAHKKAVESGEFRKVGVNCYRGAEETSDVEFHETKAEDHAMQVASLAKVRAERDNQQVADALARLGADAKAGVNVMEAIMDAVKAYATVGEMTKEMVAVYGRYEEPIRF